ncbi:MAG: hypothetical protein JO370_18190, partial [Paucibacter sp.]|nr:hypothetical protein [Roseateles sp.]
DDGVAAFYLAESGLEMGRAALQNSFTGTGVSNLNCTGIGPTTVSPLGRGAVSYSGVSTPATCSSTGVNCTSCAITATGTVGLANRTLTRNASLTTVDGTTCNSATTDCTNSGASPTWSLPLKNTTSYNAIAFFVLTYIQQGNTTATCSAGSNCVLQLALGSPSNGSKSVGMQGNAVTIPNGSTYKIYQTLSKNRDVAEVGVFFGGNTAAPTLTGSNWAGGASYWDTSNTVGKQGAQVQGTTNDGTASSTCASQSVPGSASTQACTNWCYGGDTLVFGYTVNVASLSDQINQPPPGSPGVIFNTLNQAMNMSFVTRYPTSNITNAPTDVEAEIWYASNGNFQYNGAVVPLTAGAYSYNGAGTGVIGSTWKSLNSASDNTAISSSGTVLTVGNSFDSTGTTYPTSQIISVGDVLTAPAAAAGAKIGSQLTSTEAGGKLGGRGTYSLTNNTHNVAYANNQVWTFASNVLWVTACTACDFNDSSFSTQTVSMTGLSTSPTTNAQATPGTNYKLTEALGGIGRYTLTGTAVQVASTATLLQGTPGTNIFLPVTSGVPAALFGNAARIAIKSGTGALNASAPTTAASSATATVHGALNALTLSSAPATPLQNAQLCAGTCAFFTPGGTTTYTLNRTGSGTGNGDYWASGFMCLQGVNRTIEPVTSSTTSTSTWSETVY